MPMPAADEQRPRHVEPEAVAERTEDVDAVARLERGERTRPGPDRVEQERELARRREAERHRPRQHAARRLEHEELAGDARIERAAVDAGRACTGPTALDARRRYDARAAVSTSIRSCSESAVSARAFAIACTAAVAAAIVVMHGTRATSAASRIR